MKKKLITLALSAVMVLAGAVAAYADVDYSAWSSNGIYPSDVMNTEYLTPVKYLMDKKILTGYDDGKFYPDKGITRAEFATMMAKATNNTANAEILKIQNTFSDMSGYSWANGYVNCCNQAGLIQGVGNGKFEPGREVTYAEVITIIVRSKNTSAVMEGTWPNNYIQYVQMYMNSMIGDRNITNWNAPARRGDVAMMLYRSIPKN